MSMSYRRYRITAMPIAIGMTELTIVTVRRKRIHGADPFVESSETTRMKA